MRRVWAWFLRLGGLFNKQRRDRELAEELESHLQMHIEDNLRSGMTPEEARRDALITLGGVEAVKEAYRDRRGVPWLDTMIQDLRYGVRTLRKNPGFTAVIVITLALGIGVNTAIFSLVNALLLSPLPYADAERLMQVVHQWQAPGAAQSTAYDTILGPETLAFQRENQVFSNFAYYHDEARSLAGGGEPERIECADVSVSLLPALAVQPMLGRGFSADEDRPGGSPVAMLAYGFWRRRFGGDPSVLGRTITLDEQPYTVIGVLPSSFRVPSRYNKTWDVLRPMQLGEKGHGFIIAFGRLKSGVGPEQAEATLNHIYQPFRDPAYRERVRLVKLQDWVAGNVDRSMPVISPSVFVRSVLLYQGAAAFVLLIAGANVANLLLARATRRQKEMAIRVALGAGRLRIIWQLLTESVLLALCGAGLGWLLACGLHDLVRSLIPDLPAVFLASLDARVLAFTLLAALGTSLLFGLGPALETSRLSLNAFLKEGGGVLIGGRQRHRLRGLLVVSEVALALVLLVGAGLLVKCFLQLHGLDPGIRTDRALSLSVTLSGSKYRDDRSRVTYFAQVSERLRELPGVDAVGADIATPFTTLGTWAELEIDGRSERAPCSIVNADYFRAAGIPVKGGRCFTEGDRAGAPGVMLVNERFVRRYFPNEDPVGKRLKAGDDTVDWKTIIGVVGDVRQRHLTQPPEPRVYLSYLQCGANRMNLVVRTQGDPMNLAAAVRSTILSVDPDQPIYSLMTLNQRRAEALAPQRMHMWLSSALGALALALATVGIYGVMSFAVAQRSHEIGVRMALGAQIPDVLRLVVGQGLRLTLAGVVVGLLAALGLTRFLSSLLYGVTPIDPPTFAGVAILLSGIALLACYLPARRAAKVDPMVALRYE
jgi:putative ABC transport system permease protein